MEELQKPHVAVLPFPALGHYIPLLELSRLVASHHLTVSYVTTPANLPRLQDFVDEAVNSGIDVRLAVIPTPLVEGLPEGRESSDVCPQESHGSIFALANKLEQPFDAWMERQGAAAAPVCVIFDSFMAWAPQSAKKFKISSVEFNPCGAFGVSGTISALSSIMQGTLEKEGGDCVVLSLDLPRPLRFQRHEINQEFWSVDEMNPIIKFIAPMLQSVGKGGSGLILNTFEELEPAYVQHLRNLTGKPVWSIGPLVPLSYLGGAGNKVSTRGKMADIAADELVRWLDSQTPRSVVYVSFGSVINLGREQIKALARGLEDSQQPFVWAIRVTESGSSGTADHASKYLPEGFLERTKDRGVVIWGWAPQLLILSQASVGAFMNHCGWNSTLESLSLGVPIAGWPMFADQFFNIRILAELGLGIQFCEHLDGVPEKEKVTEVLGQMLSDDKGKEMGTAMQKLKEMARKAVKDGGSSEANIQAFASEMRKLLKMRQEQSNLC